MTLKQRRLANRSGKQFCAICQEQTILVTHHIDGRKIAKFNHMDNLVDICTDCHIRTHNNLIVIEGWVSTTRGRELIYAPPKRIS